jgi:hypothetical protein
MGTFSTMMDALPLAKLKSILVAKFIILPVKLKIILVAHKILVNLRKVFAIIMGISLHKYRRFAKSQMKTQCKLN